MAATTTIPNNGLETVTNNLTKDYRYAKRKARIGFRSIAVASETAALAAAIAVAAGIGPWQVSAISIPIVSKRPRPLCLYNALSNCFMQKLVWALMWNSAEFITICINRGGIHPIANLIADLLLVFKLATAAAFACTWYTIYDGQIDTDKFCLVGTDYSTTSKDYHPPVDCTLWRVTLVCIGFTLLAWSVEHRPILSHWRGLRLKS